MGAVPILLLAHHARRRHEVCGWHRGLGPALLPADDLARLRLAALAWTVSLVLSVIAAKKAS